MTLSIRPDINSAAQLVSSLSTQQLPTVTEAEMVQAVRTLLIGLGENPDREGLKDTPKRVVKALQFLTKGYHESLGFLATFGDLGWEKAEGRGQKAEVGSSIIELLQTSDFKLLRNKHQLLVWNCYATCYPIERIFKLKIG